MTSERVDAGGVANIAEAVKSASADQVLAHACCTTPSFLPRWTGPLPSTHASARCLDAQASMQVVGRFSCAAHRTWQPAAIWML